MVFLTLNFDCKKYIGTWHEFSNDGKKNIFFVTEKSQIQLKLVCKKEQQLTNYLLAINCQ